MSEVLMELDDGRLRLKRATPADRQRLEDAVGYWRNAIEEISNLLEEVAPPREERLGLSNDDPWIVTCPECGHAIRSPIRALMGTGLGMICLHCRCEFEFDSAAFSRAIESLRTGLRAIQGSSQFVTAVAPEDRILTWGAERS
jgi:hypothetical protein